MRLTIFAILFFIYFNSFSAIRFQKVEIFMGSTFVIAFVDSNYIIAEKKYTLVRNEIIRIENLISSWNKNSETFLINKDAGIKPVKVSKELFFLIKRSKKISKLTDGYFDISYASFDNIWKFDGSRTTLPDSSIINKKLKLVNYKNIILNQDSLTVFLKNKAMRIGFGAIGKGYAANKCKALLLKLGIKNGIVDAGGDLIAWGKDENNNKWKIAIADPKNDKHNIADFNISDRAVVTSGNYEKFIEINGVKYSHIINPKTGWPAIGIRSVTIFCPDAEVADALATSIFVMGAKKGISLINKLKGFDVLIIDNDDNILVSDKLKLDNK